MSEVSCRDWNSARTNKDRIYIVLCWFAAIIRLASVYIQAIAYSIRASQETYYKCQGCESYTYQADYPYSVEPIDIDCPNCGDFVVATEDKNRRGFRDRVESIMTTIS